MFTLVCPCRIRQASYTAMAIVLLSACTDPPQKAAGTSNQTVGQIDNGLPSQPSSSGATCSSSSHCSGSTICLVGRCCHSQEVERLKELAKDGMKAKLLIDDICDDPEMKRAEFEQQQALAERSRKPKTTDPSEASYHYKRADKKADRAFQKIIELAGPMQEKAKRIGQEKYLSNEVFSYSVDVAIIKSEIFVPDGSFYPSGSCNKEFLAALGNELISIIRAK